MKPLLLRAVAFGPFGSEVEVDFERIADLGLFVVSGDTGAGKTSIFDAMFYALYGTLPGDRFKDQHVRSDHADAHAECTVSLEFLSSGVMWRATRQPTQVRAKRRGDGTTEIKATAQLERFDGTDWEPVASGVIDVDRQLQPVIGLTAAQFERVVLLPQGKFRRVLDASSSERETLLRTLFGSELFDLATRQLRDSSRALTDQVREHSAEHERSLLSIASNLEQVQLQLDVLDADQRTGRPESTVGQSAQVIALPLGQVDPELTPQRPTPTISALKDQVSAIDSGPIVRLSEALAKGEKRSAAASDRVATAKTQADLLAQRTRLENEHQRIAAQQQAVDTQRARTVEAARVAAFAIASQRHDQLSEKCASHDRSASRATARALDAAATAGVDTPDQADSNEVLDRVLADLHQREQEVESCRRDAAQARRLEVELAELTNRLDGRRAELNTCQAVIDQWESDRDSIEGERESLLSVAADRVHRDAAVAELASLLGLRSEHDDAVRELDAAVSAEQVLRGQATVLIGQRDATSAPIELGAEAEAAKAESERELLNAQALVQTKQDLDSSIRAAIECEQRAERAGAEAASLFARFLDDAAPRLAAELIDGEPCPVCGACEHPEHATASTSGDDQLVDAATITIAQDRAAAAQQTLSDARARVLQLTELHPRLADIAVAELTERVAEADAKVQSGLAAVAKGQRAGRKKAQLDTELAELQLALNTCEADVRRLQGTCDRLVGALGSHADDDMSELAVAHGAATLLADQAAQAESQLDELTQRRIDREQAAADATRRVDDLRSEVSAVQAEFTTSKGLFDLAIGKVESAMNGADPASVARDVAVAVGAVQAAQQAAADATAARSQLADSATECATELQACGHDQAATALAAAIESSELQQLTAVVREWDDNMQRVTDSLSMLSQHDLPREPPNLRVLEFEAAKAAAALTQMQERSAAIRARLDQSQTDIAELEQNSAAVIAAQSEADLANHVAGVVNGDNDQRMSLEAWVLAAYLRQVVDHANVHLHQMSHGRYGLAVATEAADQRSKHGLDLVVADAFTGTERPTRTLSGGESFQASLALALGLGDVVCNGRAGLHIDAMFIDEGFGTLDPKSIDQAVGVLDGLRSTGAMIGLITHVATVKEALPVAIEVGPSSEHAGSTIRQVA